MCLAYSRDIKEASVSPVVRVRVREVESEFEGTANVKSCRPIVKDLGFILSVMKASGELKTEGCCDLIYNFKLSLCLQLEKEVNSESYYLAKI